MVYQVYLQGKSLKIRYIGTWLEDNQYMYIYICIYFDYNNKMCLEDNILYVTYESRYIILPPFPGNPLRVHFSKYTGPCGKASTAEAKLGVLCRVSG